MKNKVFAEARDSGKTGYYLNRFLVEFNIAKNIPEANSMIRAGDIDLDNNKIKDIVYHVLPGHYDVKLKGNLIAHATLM